MPISEEVPVLIVTKANDRKDCHRRMTAEIATQIISVAVKPTEMKSIAKLINMFTSLCDDQRRVAALLRWLRRPVD